MKYHIYRTHLSGYWPKNFLDLETSCLGTIKGCSYHGLQLDSSQWLPNSIILSNTHFAPHKVPKADWDKVVLVLHANSGFDNLLEDHSAFLQLYAGPILIAPQLRAQAVAEYNLQAWLMGLGVIPFTRTWDHSRQFKRRLAQNEKVLIIGFGHVGKATYKMVNATGAAVHIYDPYIDYDIDHKKFQEIQFVRNIQWSDYTSIIFCASLTPSSQNLLVSSDQWNQLQSNVVLINATRGPLVDFDLAHTFAKKNPDAKIFLDVFTQEPFKNFDSLPNNIFTTSHIAGVHDDLLSETHRWHLQTIDEFITDGKEKILKNRLSENLRNQRKI